MVPIPGTLIASSAQDQALVDRQETLPSLSRIDIRVINQLWSRDQTGFASHENDEKNSQKGNEN